MRIFTAIPVPDNTKKRISEVMKGRLPVPYINTSNLHVTLNFFGDIDDSHVETIKLNLQKLVKGVVPFPINFTNLVKFNSQIHLVVEPSKELMSVQAALEKGFVKLGFAFQKRPYYPHVKLANLHMDKVMNPERKLENFPKEELSQFNFVATKAILYESQLLLHHTKHNPLLTLDLEI